MLPPLLIRRLFLAPLVVVIAAALAALTPAVALLSAVFGLLRRRPGPGRHARPARVAFLALAWSAGETAGLTALLGLWIASGFGGRLDTEPYRARHYAVMAWFLDLVYRAAERACGLRVDVTGPSPAPGGRPLIVLARHAGPADSLLLVHHLLSVCGRRPRVVMKATLQLDPSVDVVANRLPNVFLRRGADGSRGGRDTPPRQRTEQIRRLAAGLGPGDALLLFPEGGNWTPLRWRRAIDRLRRRGHGDLADRAAAMPSVLPPREGGAFAAIAACPDADVVFAAHTGLDRLVSVRDVWRSLLTDMEVRARWWLVPAEEVPRTAGHEHQVTWLYDWWQRMDSWITRQGAGPDPVLPGGWPWCSTRLHSMTEIPLTTVNGSYGCTRALKDGAVAPKGFTLRFEEVPRLPQAFRRMVRGLEFDVCEMAITTYLTARAHGKPFTAIPVFPVRAFHHGAILRGTAVRAPEPQSLLGRRVGVNRGYTVTSGVWARGVLADEYGLRLSGVTWVLSGDEHVAEFQPPPNVVPVAPGKDVPEMVAAGELAAGVGVPPGEGLAPLIPDASEAGYRALRERGLYPINHLVVVRDEVLAGHPDLAARLFAAYAEAKNRYTAALRDGGIASPDSSDRMYKRVSDITGEDPLPYGLAPNRAMVEQIIRHALEQKILTAPVRPEDLFVPSTLGLTA